jgi:hypothetical protein
VIPPVAPMSGLDQFLAGSKTWMTPAQIPDAFRAALSSAAWSAAPMAVAGFLAVPALLLALVWGMGAGKRRRTKNPGRRRAAMRRDRRRAATRPGRRSRSRGTHKNPETVPGIAKWSTFYGGTGAAEGKSGYDLRVGGQTYTIQPYTTKYGRHAGYSLTAYPGDPPHGHQRLGSFRSPQAAASAAHKFHGTIGHARSNPGLRRRARAAQVIYSTWRAQGQGRVKSAVRAAKTFAGPARRLNPGRRNPKKHYRR